MNNIVVKALNSKHDEKFFEEVAPVKLTESKRLKLHKESWGILSEYYLESVKITSMKNGELSSFASLKIGDRSGQVICIIRGALVGLLFGLSPEEWVKVEQLCEPGKQLFYRYFKNGLSRDFRFRQKIFYYFCLTNQKTDTLVAVFKRCINLRNKDKSDPVLEIVELKKCDDNLLDLYVSHLRKLSEL